MRRRAECLVPESYLLTQFLNSKDQATKLMIEEVPEKPRTCGAVGFARSQGVLWKCTATPGPSSASDGPGRYSTQMLLRWRVPCRPLKWSIAGCGVTQPFWLLNKKQIWVPSLRLSDFTAADDLRQCGLSARRCWSGLGNIWQSREGQKLCIIQGWVQSQ